MIHQLRPERRDLYSICSDDFTEHISYHYCSSVTARNHVALRALQQLRSESWSQSFYFFLCFLLLLLRHPWWSCCASRDGNPDLLEELLLTSRRTDA